MRQDEPSQPGLMSLSVGRWAVAGSSVAVLRGLAARVADCPSALGAVERRDPQGEIWPPAAGPHAGQVPKIRILKGYEPNIAASMVSSVSFD